MFHSISQERLFLCQATFQRQMANSIKHIEYQRGHGGKSRLTQVSCFNNDVLVVVEMKSYLQSQE